MLAIAALMLECSPPPWLDVVVYEGTVHRELIPTGDLECLLWMDDYLDALLLAVADRMEQTDDVLALGIGRAAELVVFQALREAGYNPLHVAEISDRFGYDIELEGEGGWMRIEVKGATQHTAGAFHLSRNEYDKSIAFRGEWKLVQVEFLTSVVVADHVGNEHVAGLRELSSRQVGELVPEDTASFRWERSCTMSVELDRWEKSKLLPPTELHLSSVAELGRQVRARRAGS